MDDRTLAIPALRGDDRAFSELFDIYFPRLFRSNSAEWPTRTPPKTSCNPPSSRRRGHSRPGAERPHSSRGSAYAGGPDTAALRDAAGATGGLVYTDSARTPIPELFRRILDDFRASYVLTYTPAGVDRAGTHNLVVRAKNKAYVVRARRRYERR